MTFSGISTTRLAAGQHRDFPGALLLVNRDLSEPSNCKADAAARFNLQSATLRKIVNVLIDTVTGEKPDRRI